MRQGWWSHVDQERFLGLSPALIRVQREGPPPASTVRYVAWTISGEKQIDEKRGEGGVRKQVRGVFLGSRNAAAFGVWHALLLSPKRKSDEVTDTNIPEKLHRWRVGLNTGFSHFIVVLLSSSGHCLYSHTQQLANNHWYFRSVVFMLLCHATSSCCVYVVLLWGFQVRHLRH